MPQTVQVEYYRLWDDRTWDTDFTRIPADTPESRLDEAVRKAATKIGWTDNMPVLVGHYAGPHDEDLEDNEPHEEGHGQ